jgi:hypothetical protein
MWNVYTQSVPVKFEPPCNSSESWWIFMYGDADSNFVLICTDLAGKKSCTLCSYSDRVKGLNTTPWRCMAERCWNFVHLYVGNRSTWVVIFTLWVRKPYVVNWQGPKVGLDFSPKKKNCCLRWESNLGCGGRNSVLKTMTYSLVTKCVRHFVTKSFKFVNNCCLYCALWTWHPEYNTILISCEACSERNLQ